jgi:putative hydrolase of the HAD superfamily
VSSARVGFAKPDPRIYHEAARRARVAENRCLFIDDNAGNTAAANVLGMTVVHYKVPQQLRDAFAPFLDRDNGHDGPLQTR